MTNSTWKMPVVSFQSDGVFSVSQYLRHKVGIVADLFDYTVCIRVSMYFLRGEANFFMSYANNVTDDAFNGAVRTFTSDAGNTAFRISICKHKFILAECAEQDLNAFTFNQWYHVCAVFKAFNRTAGKVAVTSKLYINGKLANQPHNQLFEPGKYKPLKSGGVLIVGQEQDDLGSFFDETQSLSGKVSQMEMWSRELNAQEVKDIAECTKATVDDDSRIVAWTNDDWEVHGNVTVNDIPVEELCHPSPLLNKLIWPEKISYDLFKGMCDKLGGELPVVPDTGVTDETLDRVTADVSAQFYGLDEPHSNIEQCLMGRNRTIFWLGQTKIGDKKTYRNPYNASTSFENFAISSSSSNCVYVFGDRVEPGGCATKFPCGVCSIPAGKLLKLKGLCEVDIERHYDTEYYIYGTMNGRAHFRGVKNSHMYFDPDMNKWRLQSLKQPSKYILTSKMVPIGTSLWEVVTENGLCKQKPSHKQELTMSLCYPNKYTCNSGDCIPLSDKCDTDIDCKDKSDEYNCDYLRFGSNYAKELIPRDVTGQPLKVFMNVSILAFPSIETVNLKFTADFFLNLRWYDLRIEFRDLNNVTSLNSLSVSDSEAIWSPRLGFTNALGPYQTTVDALTTGVLVREANPLPEDVTLSTEAMLFSGRDNAIYLTREYYQDYGCSFDLLYYPFDTQMCEMVFEVQGKTDNYVRLVKDGSGIAFLASRELVEYEIQMEALQFTSVNNISRAMVKIVFRRRMEFHVTNTFLQTFILICVGYMSLYFDVDNFTDRIMVTLTTMLVVATIMSSIQASLPKTSYYKLIDWWLLFSLNMLVLTMAFHTFVASRVAASKHQPLTLMTDNSLFKRVHGIHQPRSVMHASKERLFNNKDDLYNTPSPMGGESAAKEQELRSARRANSCGKLIYVIIVVSFNAVFWVTAIKEYLRPAAEYIGEPSSADT